MTDELFGAIEAGGTKFVCGVGTAKGEVLETVRISTEHPGATLANASEALCGLQNRYGRLSAIGIASFGPVCLDRASPDWGMIVETTKPNWSHTNVVKPFEAAFGCPVAFDTDVNGAALAEYRWGAARQTDVSVYVTVGTGVGAGIVVNGLPLHGMRHPEAGHLLPRKHPIDAEFAGVCPFHGCCVEGLASGPAILKRWGVPLVQLSNDHVGHEVVAWYLGQLAASLIAMLSPQRIVFGGGVMQAPGLIDRVRQAACQIDAGYSCLPEKLVSLITLPGCGEHSGTLGAIALAEQAFQAPH